MSAETAMHCDGLGAIATPIDPATQCPDCGLYGAAHYMDCPAAAPPLGACHYSAGHLIADVPATQRLDIPALGDIFPQGVPCCDACADFYRRNA